MFRVTHNYISYVIRFILFDELFYHKWLSCINICPSVLESTGLRVSAWSLVKSFTFSAEIVVVQYVHVVLLLFKNTLSHLETKIFPTIILQLVTEIHSLIHKCISYLMVLSILGTYNIFYQLLNFICTELGSLDFTSCFKFCIV